MTQRLQSAVDEDRRCSQLFTRTAAAQFALTLSSDQIGSTHGYCKANQFVSTPASQSVRVKQSQSNFFCYLLFIYLYVVVAVVLAGIIVFVVSMPAITIVGVARRGAVW